MPNANLNRHTGVHTVTRVYALMKDKKRRTVAQAAEELSLSDAPVYAAFKKLRTAREIRICDWKTNRVNGRFLAIYELGSAPDAPKPERRDWKQLISEDEHARRIAEELARPAFRHWQDVAFFGEARA